LPHFDPWIKSCGLLKFCGFHCFDELAWWCGSLCSSADLTQIGRWRFHVTVMCYCIMATSTSNHVFSHVTSLLYDTSHNTCHLYQVTTSNLRVLGFDHFIYYISVMVLEISGCRGSQFSNLTSSRDLDHLRSQHDFIYIYIFNY